MNYGVDTGFYPLGSCTMKYNPKVAETVGGAAGVPARCIRMQPDETVQGALEMLWRLERGAVRDHRDGARHAAAAGRRVRAR